MTIPDFKTNHSNKSKLQSGYRDREENNLTRNYFGLCIEQMSLSKLLDFSYLELTDISNKGIF